MADSQKLLYSWKFEDKKDRSPLWYILALSIVIGVVIWGFLTKQYGLSFIFMIITGVVFYVENNSEDEVEVEVTDLGMKIAEKFYDYSRIKSYSVIYSGDKAMFLKLKLSQKGINVLNVKVSNAIVSDIRPIISQFIEENPQEDLAFVDRIIHLLKL